MKELEELDVLKDYMGYWIENRRYTPSGIIKFYNETGFILDRRLESFEEYKRLRGELEIKYKFITL